MIYNEFASGKKDIGLIISPKLYSWGQFIGSHYGVPLKKYDNDFPKRFVGISTLEKADGKKPTKKELVQQCADILESCATIGIDKLIIANSEYFKYLSGAKGFEDEIGNIFQCVIEGYEYITVIPMLNASVLNAQPNKKQLLDKALAVVGKFLQGSYEAPKEHVFASYELVTDVRRAKELLDTLLTSEVITSDIETTGLRVGEAEVLTIAFAKDEYNAFTIACHKTYTEYDMAMVQTIKDFFSSFKGKIIFHNALFDIKQIVYNWYMKDFSDNAGLIAGLNSIDMTRIDDTMLMAYAELNSTERTPIGLKVLAKDFLGDWAEDVKDCLSVPLETLAFYNAKDVVGTYYVYNRFKHQMGERAYKEILQPSLKPLIKMMVTGLPIDMDRVDVADKEITLELEKANSILRGSAYVLETEENLRYFAAEKYNATHVGNKEPWQFDLEFNPNSAVQLRVLLFDVMDFEPIEMTEGGSPKTDRASIKEFLSECPEDDERINTLKALITISETAIIQNTFISAFKEMSLADGDGNYTLHGNLRLGGTQSGRLSSSEPNLNISLK